MYKKWEYKSIVLNGMWPDSDDKLMNELGERGWEIYAIATSPNDTRRAYSKRPKEMVIEADNPIVQSATSFELDGASVLRDVQLVEDSGKPII